MKSSTKWAWGAVIVVVIAGLAIWYAASSSQATPGATQTVNVDPSAPAIPPDSGTSYVEGQSTSTTTTVHATTTKKKVVK